MFSVQLWKCTFCYQPMQCDTTLKHQLHWNKWQLHWQSFTQDTAISEPIIVEQRSTTQIKAKSLYFAMVKTEVSCDVRPWRDVSEKWRVLVHLSMLTFKTRNFCFTFYTNFRRFVTEFCNSANQSYTCPWDCVKFSWWPFNYKYFYCN